MMLKLFRSKHYLDWIDRKPCLICRKQSTHHHVRMYGDCGTGQKPPDSYCVPLCPECHGKLHQQGEKSFWNDNNIAIGRIIIRLNAEYLQRQKDRIKQAITLLEEGND